MGLFLFLFVLNFTLVILLHEQTRVGKAHAQILQDLERLDYSPSNQLSQPPLVLGAIDSEVKLADGRAANLQRFLRSINSPLFEYTDIIVEEADKHGYDYRVLVAIAMQESTGCKRIPPDSYNCWGWGIYGDTVTKFSSYEEGIRIVSSGIKRLYIDKGLITTEDIMRKYTPSSNGSWAWAVRHFFQRIEAS
ncbi:MAG: hypothetical protein UZ22_OP11002000550 [Microgenomates bacterium OLB23]|nr:MAG: hypothetical protein UZ22_OP11002000550 [Microgenomates bacterium OLB23]